MRHVSSIICTQMHQRKDHPCAPSPPPSEGVSRLSTSQSYVFCLCCKQLLLNFEKIKVHRVSREGRGERRGGRRGGKGGWAGGCVVCGVLLVVGCLLFRRGRALSPLDIAPRKEPNSNICSDLRMYELRLFLSPLLHLKKTQLCYFRILFLGFETKASWLHVKAAKNALPVLIRRLKKQHLPHKCPERHCFPSTIRQNALPEI